MSTVWQWGKQRGLSFTRATLRRKETEEGEHSSTFGHNNPIDTMRIPPVLPRCALTENDDTGSDAEGGHVTVTIVDWQDRNSDPLAVFLAGNKRATKIAFG